MVWEEGTCGVQDVNVAVLLVTSVPHLMIESQGVFRNNTAGAWSILVC